ncbi:hypothetical protein [Micromonospora sonneratiae]|uniref:Uncharacterized protein n=1 Tax=Micromonospora sonneratiae TaxID=1184706 RepID=A0ABW3YRF1_9ACTN
MLLRLAGRLPDDLLTQARAWLAEETLTKIAEAVVATAVTQRLTVHPADVELLASLLPETGEGRRQVAGLATSEQDVVPPYVFQPVSPEEANKIRRRGGTVPVALDLTTGAPLPLDSVDAAAVEAVAASSGVRGLWRSWRLAADRASWPLPRRVYLVEVDDPGQRHRLAADLQGLLAAAGEATPQVEVTAVGAAAAYYQRTARGGGALLWAREAAPAIENVSVFDLVDPVLGATFAPDHPLVTDPSIRAEMLDYLDNGHPLMFTTATIDDVVDVTRGSVVPLNFRTDGTWLWPEAVTYYLREHNLRPDDRLVEHMERAGYQISPLDGVAIFRTLTKLQEPPESEPVWRFHDDEPDDVESPS